jgi:6-phosphofructokinase
MVLQQSNEEVLRIWSNWSARVPRLINNEQTADLIADFVAKHYNGLVTQFSLDAAVEALADQVLKPEPTQIDIAKKMEAKMRADYAASRQPQTVVGVEERNAQLAAQATKDAQAKELRELNAQIDREISSHVKGHQSGHQDYAGTASEQDSLKLVASIHNRTNIAGAKLALNAVRVAKRKL